MSKSLILRPDAKNDLAEIHDYLKEQSERALAKFDSRLQKVFEQIESMPFLFAKVHRRARIARVGRFKYLVIYVVYSNAVEVVAVMHGSRSPSAWKSRL